MSVVLLVEIERTELPKRTHAKIMRDSLRAAVVNHVNKTLGKHFKPGAAAEYGYAQRSPAYMLRKRRMGFGDVPLVRTGRLQRTIRAASLPTVTATQHRASVFLRSYFPLTPDRRREIESMSAADRQTAQDVALQHYRKEAAKPSNRLKRRRKIR